MARWRVEATGKRTFTATYPTKQRALEAAQAHCSGVNNTAALVYNNRGRLAIAYYGSRPDYRAGIGGLSYLEY